MYAYLHATAGAMDTTEQPSPSGSTIPPYLCLSYAYFVQKQRYTFFATLYFHSFRYCFRNLPSMTFLHTLYLENVVMTHTFDNFDFVISAVSQSGRDNAHNCVKAAR